MSPVLGEVPGLTVRYQGYICSPIFHVQRNVGLEPDFAHVFIDKAQLGKIHIKDIPGGVDSLTVASVLPDAFSGDPAQQGSANNGGLYVVGDLTISEVWPDGQNTRSEGVTFHNMLLSERSIENVIESDDGTGEIKIELEDIRRLWQDRGFVFAWVNTPRRYFEEDKASASSSEPIDVLNFGGLEETEFLSAIGTGKLTVGSPDFFNQLAALLGKNQPKPNPKTTSDVPYILGALREGKPWTLREVLRDIIFPCLPGQPGLKFLSPELENFVVPPHKWEGTLAKECLRQVLDEADAVLALNPDSSCSIWKRGMGPCQEADGTEIKKGDEAVTTMRLLMSHRHVPKRALVLGLPIVESFEEELVPCGEDENGRLVPLDFALARVGMKGSGDYGELTLEDIKTSALNGHTVQGVQEYEKWAFKWFTFKDNLLNRTPHRISKLPIEDLAETDVYGVRKPPVVGAESFEVVDQRALRGYAAAAKAKATEARKMKGGAKVTRESSPPPESRPVWDAVTAGEEFVGYGNDRPKKPTIDPNADTKIDLDPGKDIVVTRATAMNEYATSIIEQVKANQNQVVVNIPLSVQGGGSTVSANGDPIFAGCGYRIDRERGVVMFDAPRVKGDKPGDSPRKNKAIPAKVVIRYGSTRKARLDYPLSIQDRYYSVWENKAELGVESEDYWPGSDGQVQPRQRIPSIVKVDGKVENLHTLAPIVTELQELRGLPSKQTATIEKGAGRKTNREELDGHARRIVEARLAAETFVAGAVFELHRPAELVNTGRVLSVVWTSAEDGGPRVSAYDSQFMPLSNNWVGRFSPGPKDPAQLEAQADTRFTPGGD